MNVFRSRAASAELAGNRALPSLDGQRAGRGVVRVHAHEQDGDHARLGRAPAARPAIRCGRARLRPTRRPGGVLEVVSVRPAIVSVAPRTRSAGPSRSVLMTISMSLPSVVPHSMLPVASAGAGAAISARAGEETGPHRQRLDPLGAGRNCGDRAGHGRSRHHPPPLWPLQGPAAARRPGRAGRDAAARARGAGSKGRSTGARCSAMTARSISRSASAPASISPIAPICCPIMASSASSRS